MIGQFLLAFREGLEAALITAIILAYLNRTDQKPLSRYIWLGVYSAVAASIFLGAGITFLYGSLTGPTKPLFEGTAALIGVFVLSSMIYWMATKGRELQTELEIRVEDIVTRGATIGLISFSFTVVFREGLETVLFLTPFLVNDVVGTLIGATLGIVVSAIIAYGIFIAGMRINLQRLFYFTSILLVLLAGGLIGYGVHELIEFFKDIGIVIGWPGDFAYVLNIPAESPFHHKGIIGSIFAVLFGYTVKAEWARIIFHLTYLGIALPLVLYVYRRVPPKP
jgi:high-affinity iron transporter